jgi:hypothetical protein
MFTKANLNQCSPCVLTPPLTKFKSMFGLGVQYYSERLAEMLYGVEVSFRKETSQLKLERVKRKTIPLPTGCGPTGSWLQSRP